MAVALVGRGTEQAELTSTWQAARGGQARVVGLAGPAGIGKTALVGQFLRDAAPARPVWVSGAPEERTLSWGVLGQAVPALGPALRPGPPPVWAAPDPEADPLYVGQSFLDDVRAAGETILVLDDAHWADRQSQAALRFAARHMTGLPVLVIVIHNDEVPLDESWRRLFGSAHGSLVTLAGLTPEELVRLAVARGHFGLSPAAAARLHEHTGGNPLYASALLAQLPARDLAAGALPAPRSIVETVAANLAGRSEPAVALLSAAAVLGRSFDVAQASALRSSPARWPALARPRWTRRSPPGWPRRCRGPPDAGSPSVTRWCTRPFTPASRWPAAASCTGRRAPCSARPRRCGTASPPPTGPTRSWRPTSTGRLRWIPCAASWPPPQAACRTRCG